MRQYVPMALSVPVFAPVRDVTVDIFGFLFKFVSSGKRKGNLWHDRLCAVAESEVIWVCILEMLCFRFQEHVSEPAPFAREPALLPVAVGHVVVSVRSRVQGEVVLLFNGTL